MLMFTFYALMWVKEMKNNDHKAYKRADAPTRE